MVDLEVELEREPRFRELRARGPSGQQARTLRLLVGDGSGARSELCVPYQQRCVSPAHLSSSVDAVCHTNHAAVFLEDDMK